MNSNKILLLFAIAVAAYAIGKYLWAKPKYVAGERFEMFSHPLANGDEFQLSDLSGQLVLIDFWGSWCGPCRKENPGLARLYSRFNQSGFTNESGFEIVSIALESNRDYWARTVRSDGMNWPYHILDLNLMDSELAGKYSVREIPTKYLINGKGRIISVNPSIDELGQILTDRLK